MSIAQLEARGESALVTASAPATRRPGPAGGRDRRGPLPPARGPLSEALRRSLGDRSGSTGLPPSVRVRDPLADDDLHLALYLCYELTYRGVDGVEDEREWDPAVLAFRGQLERAFERGLRDALPDVTPAPDAIAAELRALAVQEGGPSLSRYVERDATLEELREFVIHRSAYHLKEADPHSLAIPRLSGEAKAALMEIQADEYGDGDATRMHSALFAGTMRALGLDPRYGAYLSRIPGATLALTNLMSLFGMHRRLTGALVGHLALFELTSCIPNRRYANGLRRCGAGSQATRFFDVHVEADAAHGAIAAEDLAGGFVDGDAARAEEVLFGARALQLLEACVGSSWIETWGSGGSTLLPEAIAS